MSSNPVLRELYEAKEALHRVYRIRGHARAKRALTRFTETLGLSAVPELKTLRRTLIKWRKEILRQLLSRAAYQRPHRRLQPQGEASQKKGLRL